MSEENKAIVGRWFTEFWGNPWNPAVIDEIAAPDIRFEYSMHAPLRGRDAVVFAVHDRPMQGARGTYRVRMRHGVSRLRSGHRHTVGVIFHDAK